jgi:hypothetical protein
VSQVVSFVDYVPAARFDLQPWVTARIEEAAVASGPWTAIDTIALTPADADPAHPQSRNLTTANASDTVGLWYRIVWLDAALAQSATAAVQNVPQEALSPLALCTDEDVRAYLAIPSGDLSEDDRNTIIRLVNAASDTFTRESQRIWKNDGEDLPRFYLLDSFDLAVGRIRIDDCTAVTDVSYGDFRSSLGATALDDASFYAVADEPGWPITRIVFLNGLPLQAGYGLAVTADWGWPAIPETVRQAVIYTAAEWYARDVEKFSATFSIDQGRVLLPQVLPVQVQRMAEDFRRWRVA